MPSYQIFADFYDSLTDNVEYEKRADYIINLLEEKHHHKMGLTLDLACGTGTLTLLLKEKGVDIYGVDGSSDMLSVAQQKSYEKGIDTLFLCQQMDKLDLYGTIDTCVCTLDSLNHITDEKAFEKAIERVSVFMNKGGYFLFDLNTIYKHREVLADNAFVFENDDVFCVWQNTPAESDIVEIDLDFFVRYNDTYIRYSEFFCERAYSLEFVKKVLERCGFSIEGIYGDLSYSPPEDEEERVIIVARKV